MTTTDPTPADVARVAQGRRLLDLVEQIHTLADELAAAPLDGVDATLAVQVDYELDLARKKVSKVEDRFAEHAAGVWPGQWSKQLDIPGVGQARPYRTKGGVKYDHAGLVAAVVEKRLAAAGGEIPADPTAVVGWVLEAAAIHYWRGGVLEQLGVHVDNYRTTTPGVTRLSIRQPRSDDQ